MVSIRRDVDGKLFFWQKARDGLECLLFRMLNSVTMATKKMSGVVKGAWIGFAAVIIGAIITAGVVYFHHEPTTPSQSVKTTGSNSPAAIVNGGENQIGGHNVETKGNNSPIAQGSNAVAIASVTVNGGNNQFGNNNTQNITENNITGDGMPPDTKQAIRSVLHSIHPDLISELDGGKKELDVFIGNFSATKLQQLSERPDFRKFLSLKETDNQIIDSPGSSINGILNEVDAHGTLTLFLLYPTDELKSN